MLAETAETVTVAVPAWLLAVVAFLGTLLGGAERLHLTCYPAFVPALSEWRPKRVRFIGMNHLIDSQRPVTSI